MGFFKKRDVNAKLKVRVSNLAWENTCLKRAVIATKNAGDYPHAKSLQITIESNISCIEELKREMRERENGYFRPEISCDR